MKFEIAMELGNVLWIIMFVVQKYVYYKGYNN
jgi:hypothetical protein